MGRSSLAPTLGTSRAVLRHQRLEGILVTIALPSILQGHQPRFQFFMVWLIDRIEWASPPIFNVFHQMLYYLCYPPVNICKTVSMAKSRLGYITISCYAYGHRNQWI